MATKSNYLAYVMIAGLRCGIEISADNPDDAMAQAQEAIKEIPPEKVGTIRLADTATGLFIRGYS